MSGSARYTSDIKIKDYRTMSRIGKKSIEIPKGVTVDLAGTAVKVRGPKGELSRVLHSSMTVAKEDALITVRPKVDSGTVRKFHGLTRTLIYNMVLGVTQGFQKKLLLIGVGYRAAVKDKELNLTLGYSHPVIYLIPKGIQIQVDKQTEITVAGADKEQVGQVAADIRAFRRPEPYHGKGIKYADEVIVTKVGKSGGKK